MSDALNTINSVLGLKSRIMQINRQEAAIKAEQAEKESPLYQQEQANKLTGAYIEGYNNVVQIAETLGETPEVIQARNNAKLQMRAALTVPLSIAAAGQHMHKNGAGEVASSSTETSTMILDNEGYDKDTQDRIQKMMLKSGAAAQGIQLPEMGLADQSMNIVSDLYGITKEETKAAFSAASITPSSETEGLLARVTAEATTVFNDLMSSKGQSPESRITWAVQTAMINQDVSKSVGASEALYISNSTMEGLERRQNVRVQKALAQLPALNRQYEEEAATVLYEFMHQAHQAGKAVTYDNIMQSVGENEMLHGFRNQDGLADTYQNVKTNIAALNQNYDQLSERDRFSMFVGAFADFAAHNVNSGSPIRDQYQLGGLERLRTAADTGQLYAKFDGLVAPLEALWADFESQHNEVVVARNEVMARNTNAGRVSAVAPDGKVASWKDIQEPLRNERVSNLIADPAVFGLLNDMNKVTTDKDGNYSLDIGNIHIPTLQKFSENMNLGGDWGNMVIQPKTPTTNAVTVKDSFSQAGLDGWGQFIADTVNKVQSNQNWFNGKEKILKGVTRGTINDRLGEFEYKGVPIGKIIGNSAELKMALQNGMDDPNQIEAVINTALGLHFDTIDSAVMDTRRQAESDIVTDLINVLPTEVQATARKELTTGSFNAIQQELPKMEQDYIQATEQYHQYLNSVTPDTFTPQAAGPSFKRYSPEERAELYSRRIAQQKAERRLKTVRNKMNNYANEIDKRGEVEALENAFGTTPPRTWAFLQNLGEMVESVDWTIDLYKTNTGK